MQNMQMLENFNENDPKYKCCCGCFDVVTGVKVFLVLYIFGNTINSIFVILTSNLTIAGLMFGLLVIVTLCTIHALINEKHAYLWAFIIVTMISFVLCCVYLLLSSYLYFFNKEFAEQFIKNYFAKGIDLSDDEVVELIKTAYAIYVSLLLVQLAHNIWVLRVLFGCKRYFEDKSEAKIMKSINDHEHQIMNLIPHPSN